MILYDIVKDARTILIDTNSVAYRWSDQFFHDEYAKMVELVYTFNVSQFYDENGNIEKGTYRFSEPILTDAERAVVGADLTYVVGDIIHNTDNEMFECTVAGDISAVANPTWNIGYNALTTDGTVTWKNLERNDLPFPDHTKTNQVAYLVHKAYEIDSTDQNNYQLSQEYKQIFEGML